MPWFDWQDPPRPMCAADPSFVVFLFRIALSSTRGVDHACTPLERPRTRVALTGGVGGRGGASAMRDGENGNGHGGAGSGAGGEHDNDEEDDDEVRLQFRFFFCSNSHIL